MQEVGYAFIINCINTLMGFYLPAMCILIPRKGKKSVIWIAFSALHTVWVLLSRYVMEFSAVIYPLIYGQVVTAALLELFYRDNRKQKLAFLVYWFLTGILADMTALLCMRVFVPEVIEIYLKGQIPEAAVMTYLMGNLCCGILVMIEAIIYFCLIRTKQKRLFGAFLLLAAYQFVLGTGFFILCFDYTERVA